jgi:hypothetical protein
MGVDDEMKEGMQEEEKRRRKRRFYKEVVFVFLCVLEVFL